MRQLKKIGIIGLGYVGNAVLKSYPWENCVCIDSDPNKYYKGTYDDIMQTGAIFVCVPSPMNADGSCDTSILEEVLAKLTKYKGVIISKVTAPPDTYRRLGEEYSNLVYAPEFLTAANAEQDYLSAKWCVIGGTTPAYMHEAEEYIKQGQSSVSTVMFSSLEEASLFKYTINSFLATKVVFMNEVRQLADSIGADYKTIQHMFRLEPRLGNSHFQVPGPDGTLGFGGACFPKDTEALLKFAQTNGCQLNVLEAAVKKNTLLRLTDNSK